MSKFVVIGGQGFIGAAFVDSLKRRGHSVTIVSRDSNFGKWRGENILLY